MLQLTCPHCGKALQIPEKYAGQSGKCKHCQQPIMVPPLAQARPENSYGIPDDIDAQLDAPSAFDEPPVVVERKRKLTQEEQQRIGCLLLFIILAALFWRGCLYDGEENKPKPSRPVTSQRPIAPKQRSLEYKLAIINKRGYVSEDDITVRRFRFLLGDLDNKFIESRQQIADMSVLAVEMLDEVGIAESLLNIMEGVNSIFPIKMENQRYAEYSAAYVTLRKKGMQHDEAVGSLGDIIRALSGR